jgi:DNA-binding NarL/FixJ family response regulator
MTAAELDTSAFRRIIRAAEPPGAVSDVRFTICPGRGILASPADADTASVSTAASHPTVVGLFERGLERMPAMSVVLVTADGAFAAAFETSCQGHALEIAASARTAAAAVGAATAISPDLCLIDRDMWEIAARSPRTKIVLIGGVVSDEELFEALRGGIDGFLFKDMNLDRLPLALLDVRSGNAALPRDVAARVLAGMRGSQPTWRSVTLGKAGRRLTVREWEVLELLGEELTTYAIADRLVLTPGAVRSHVSSAVRKLGAASRDDAVRLLRGAAA